MGYYSVASFGDYDNDGDADMFTGGIFDPFRAFANDGTGVFAELTGAQNPFDGISVGVGNARSFADIDGDGDLDLVAGQDAGTLRTFANDGAGAFSELIGVANPFDGIDVGTFSSPGFSDIDADGDLDLVVGVDEGTLRSFANNGAGVFTELTGAANPFDGVDVGGYSVPVFFDLDADGDEDMLSGTIDGILKAFISDGAGNYSQVLTRGYDPTAYTDIFNGTSASAPVVSGVVALMLDANEGLGWRDVQNILAASASLTGSAFDDATADTQEDGLWSANASGTWNGGGHHVHTNYGYGMVNAYNAARMAEVWTLFAAAQTSANEQTVTSGLNDFADTLLPDGTGAGFSTTFTITGNLSIEHVALRLNFSADYVGDLRAVLTSAAGTEVVVKLEKSDLYDNVGNVNWLFGIDGLRGELSAGSWTMTVSDRFAGNSLTVRDASLDIFGSTASANDVYHFTDEYLAMRAYDSARATIADTDGGIDWLNFAAVKGSIALNLAAGQIVQVLGVAWATLANAFENAVTGEGNDRLTGTDGTNNLWGMRGNDLLTGGGGADRTSGGAGMDTLNGGLGNDTMIGGAGNDTYIVDATGDRVFETTTTASVIDAGGTDTVRSSVNFNLDANAGVRFVENLVLTGTANIKGTGNALANRLTGNAGNNVLNGGLGNDTLLGGAGNDTYIVDATGDRVFEATTTASAIDAGGTDTVQSAVTFNLDANAGVRFVENLVLTGTANINGTGNALANRLTGNAGNNVLNGGLGNDTLFGGAGHDNFVFNAAPSAANVDRISDFNVAEDTVRLDDVVFVGLTAGTLGASAFASNMTGQATEALDRIIYESDTGRVYFDADGNGVGASVHLATMTANLALTHADFFVF